MAKLFEKYGEFDSAEEINRAAAAQKAEGDFEAVYQIAEENGIDRDDAQAFIDGEEEELCNDLMAAYGKLKVEAEYYEFKGVMEDWLSELRQECTDSPELARNVRRKGRSLAGYAVRLIEDSFHNKVIVHKDIQNKCSKAIKDIMGTHPLTIGSTNLKGRKRIMKSYYGGDK